MFQQKIKFSNSLGLSLSAIFEGKSKDDPTVILCHGYGSSKDSTSQVPLSKKLIEKGLSVFRFDFTGCGESEGELVNLKPTQGLDDLKSAVKELDKKDFALYGSSFGGHVSLWYASQNPVLALALKAPVSDYSVVVPREASERRKFFIEDTKGLGIYKEARNITCPVIIFHGDRDDVVPLEQSKKLVKNLGGEPKLKVLKGADHDIRAPYIDPMQTKVADFFAKNLLSN